MLPARFRVQGLGFRLAGKTGSNTVLGYSLSNDASRERARESERGREEAGREGRRERERARARPTEREGEGLPAGGAGALLSGALLLLAP